MHHHHIWYRKAEQLVVAGEQPLENIRQVSTLLDAQVRYGRDTPPGVNVRLVGKTGIEQDEGRKVFAFDQDSTTVPVLPGEKVVAET